ncbi:M50 family metallopeptidase [Bacillus solimangrovi]|uniref:Stage IV sporulation protein FB n=1 Tax=Bacillus solimangrovi TaxID=1305675 RepID=A0A1E5LBJ9_9BACI|nr:M50 family metallopeptidase [Bacillus solimangrovi]OEH91468.1 stage IV sporulation protein FB [Bacillus solimangrovi]
MINFLSLFKKCSIHPLFWAVAAIGILSGRFVETIMVFVIIFVHEMGHAATAHFFHWRIKKIELFPFGGVAEMDEYGNRPLREEMLIIVAGPLQHFWMIGLSYILLQFNVIDLAFHQLFVMHNLFIACFNMLPIWPLDGGKLLLTVLSSQFPFRKAYRLALVTSFLCFSFIVCLHLIFSYYHLNLWFIIAFLLFAQWTEWKQQDFAHVRFLLERHYGKTTEIAQLQPINVQETLMIQEVFNEFCRGCKHQVLMKTKQGEQIVIDENELLHAFFTDKQTNCTVGDIFR